jgi:hypothetical protein
MLPSVIIILSAVLVWRWHELLVLINDADQVFALLTLLPIKACIKRNAGAETALSAKLSEFPLPAEHTFRF